MPDKRLPRDGKKRRKQAKASGPTSDIRFARHPLFGNIPLVHHSTVGLGGKQYEWWQHDPNYEPPLPPGAVRGDVRKQVFCPAHHDPKYFYVDEDRQCIQCGKDFIFHAKEQKYWYEALKFNFSSIPIRCLQCRRERRSEHALREQIARAKADVRAKNPAGHIALARAIVEYHERTKQGNLNEAIAASRKAAALWPNSSEPYLWEGIAQALSGRRDKAQISLKTFLFKTPNAPLALRNKAHNYLKH
jgi:putative zinc ribbon protein